MKKRTNLTKLIQFWGIILLLGIGSSIIVVDIIRSYGDFKLSADEMRTNYTAQQQRLIKREVGNVVDMIHYEKSQSEIVTKRIIKTRIYEAYAIAQNIYLKNKSLKGKREIQQMIIDALSPIRFENGGGYYFIFRLDGLAILFPSKPGLEGSSLLQVQDSHKQWLTKDMIKIIRQSGEGFYQYHWLKPNNQGDDNKKLSFIKGLGIYDWFIGSGLYLDDVQEDMKTKLLTKISKVRFGKEGYIFVNKLNGDALVANGKRILGNRKLWEVFDKNSEKTKDIFKKEYDAGLNPDGDFIHYSIIKLTNPNKESPKASFIYGIPDWQWLIGAGVYLDDVETDIAKMQNELNNQIKKKMFYFILISIGILVFFFLLFNRLNRKLKYDFDLFFSFFGRAALSDEPIDRSRIHFKELDWMARNANKMLADRRQVEDALKESEERYSTIFKEARDGIVLIETETGDIIECNPQFEKMSGRSPSELKQMKIWEILQADEATDVKEKYAAIKGKDYGRLIKVDFKRSDGKTIPVEFISKRVSFQNRHFLLSVARDISERKHTTAVLQKMEKLKSVGILAGGIAHDFNNILMGLFGNISLAKKDIPKDHPALKSLDLAEKSMNRAIRLTKQLLTFSKGSAPITDSVQLNSLIEDVVRFDLSGSNVKSVFGPSENIWPANVDKGQIQQVFSNFTINAKHAMPDGGKLNITFDNADISDKNVPGLDPGKYIRITIADNGSGIKEDHLDKIFDPYFTTKQTGNGLGLATVYSIIRQHGGSVDVVSKLGEGTTFTVYLPASEADQMPEIRHDQAKATLSRQSGRILIMDDEQMVRTVVSAMLTKSGYSVETAVDGTQALKQYKLSMADASVFDAVIMDLTIPGGLGGKDVIKDILDIDPAARVIVSSGYTDDPIMANYAEYGFTGRIAKPYTLKMLTEVLAKILDNR